MSDMSNEYYDQGILNVSRQVFGEVVKGKNGYLNTPDTFPLYDEKGKFNHRSFYGCIHTPSSIVSMNKLLLPWHGVC